MAALAAVVHLAALLGVVGLVVGLVAIAGKEREAVAAKGAADDARKEAEDALKQLQVLMEREQQTSGELRDKRDQTHRLLADERRTGYLQSIVLAGRELEGQPHRAAGGTAAARQRRPARLGVASPLPDGLPGAAGA